MLLLFPLSFHREGIDFLGGFLGGFYLDEVAPSVCFLAADYLGHRRAANLHPLVDSVKLS